ncbi:MAG: FAD-binding protein, partial [Acidobacteriota bacterium]
MLSNAILAELRAALPEAALITQASQLQTYECDGLTNFRTLPSAVTLPKTSAEVQKIVQICARHKVPFVARGAGTGLSGGALPTEGSVIISLARMNRFLSTDLDNQRITVEPGVTNSQVTDRVK